MTWINIDLCRDHMRFKLILESRGGFAINAKRLLTTVKMARLWRPRVRAHHSRDALAEPYRFVCRDRPNQLRNHIPPRKTFNLLPLDHVPTPDIFKIPETSRLSSVKANQRGPIGSFGKLADVMPWPDHPKFLQPNKNDTWNDFQKLHRGKIVTTTAWREARDTLHREFREYLAKGGVAQVQAADLEEMARSVQKGKASHPD
jgi:hypothetical protein